MQPRDVPNPELSAPFDAELGLTYTDVTPDGVKAELTVKQASILAAASTLVKPGGRLVYATCSLLAAENREVVMAFLAAHPDFALLDAGEILARQGVSGLSGQSEGMLQLLPSLQMMLL